MFLDFFLLKCCCILVLIIMADTESTENKSDPIADYKAFCKFFSYGMIVKLDGSNYQMWSTTFTMSIKGYKSRHIIEEDELKSRKICYLGGRQ